MQDFLHQHILVGVSGGIAAYKAVYLVRALTKLGAEVRVVMTASAMQFVTPLTFQALSGHPVATSLWDQAADHAMDHITLARWADQLVIFPATANCIAKLAQGVADDLLTTLYLTVQCPVTLCPAMNPTMWSHPAVQHNLHALQARQVWIMPPEPGLAACQEPGVGRACDPDHLIQCLRLPASLTQRLGQVPVLITAGPTREPLDPVRYLSNHSSGKMGYALAYAAWRAGANVTLISGPTACTLPACIPRISVETARQMQEAVFAHLVPQCLFIGAAAVADFTPKAPHAHKLKQHTALSLALNPTLDIIAAVAQRRVARYVVGFAAETQALMSQAQEKLTRKQLDMIIANEVGPGKGFDQETNQVCVITQTEVQHFPLQHKTRLAGEIIRLIGHVA